MISSAVGPPCHSGMVLRCSAFRERALSSTFFHGNQASLGPPITGDDDFPATGDLLQQGRKMSFSRTDTDTLPKSWE